MSFESFGSFGASGSSLNPALAWSMGTGGKGRVEIKFPFQMAWYREQPCTTFQSLQHRKEPKGFQHEFIILNMTDGSKCRIERMGDPDARFDALSPQGSVAHDFAQCYSEKNLDDPGPNSSDIRSKELSKKNKDTSQVVAEIFFPRKLDLMDVLKICRAIHEGDKTRNYTLQGYNCYFFSLAIQCCLTRLVSGWEKLPLDPAWTSALHAAIGSLPGKYWNLLGVQSHTSPLLGACSALDPSSAVSLEALQRQVLAKLASSLDMTLDPKNLSSALRSELWYSNLGSVPLDLVQEGIKYALMEIMIEHGSSAPPNPSNDDASENARRKCFLALLRLLSSAQVGDGLEYRLTRPAILLYCNGSSNRTFSNSTAESHKANKPDRLDRANKLETSTVNKTNTVDAANATNATNATNAPNATNATNAPNAPNAPNATDATNATNTMNATNATNAANAAKTRTSPPDEMGYRGTPVIVQTVQNFTTTQWVSICWCHLRTLLWWALRTILGLWGVMLPGVDTESHPCVIIDTRMAHMVVELEQSRPASANVLDNFCKEVDALRENDSAIWEKQPWGDIQQAIGELPSPEISEQKAERLQVWLNTNQGVQPESVSISNAGFISGRLWALRRALEQGLATFRSQSVPEHPQKSFSWMSVSEFQRHIQTRIELQAKLVERVMLGDATKIQTELQNKLAQAWSLIRDEADIAGIVAELARRGCPDLTWELDRKKTSSSPMKKDRFSRVCKGALLDGSTVVLSRQLEYSIYRRSEPMGFEHTVRELYAWEKARHENILELRGMAIFNGGIVTVSPWTKLSSIGGYHDPDRCFNMCVQVASGVAHLHSIPLFHGDLKADNIGITDDGIVKIGNFREAGQPSEHVYDAQLSVSTSARPAFMRRWMAPEMMIEGSNKDHKSLEADIYALGMTIFEIFTGKAPFADRTDLNVLVAVAFEKSKPVLPSRIHSLGKRGNQLWGLLNQCWDSDPKRRPKADQVVRQLETISNLPA